MVISMGVGLIFSKVEMFKLGSTMMGSGMGPVFTLTPKVMFSGVNT